MYLDIHITLKWKKGGNDIFTLLNTITIDHCS